MSGDECKVVRLHEVEVQENGIIRDEYGWIIGYANDEWMRYQWRLLESGRNFTPEQAIAATLGETHHEPQLAEESDTL